jgi:NAD(P)-dependent dehydrogenase (short-subunit alcohol dehydrogenase family)
MNDNKHTSTMTAREWGLQPEALATKETIYRDKLFDGRNFVVSGAGSGMGRACLFLLLRLGANVMICGRNEAKLNRAAEDAERLLGRSPHVKVLDIRQPEAVVEFATHAFDTLGGVDSLVNSAGGQFPQNAIDFSVNGWNAVIDTNLNGPFWMMQAFARQWRDRHEPGNIVAITMNSERGVPQSAHSCAARAGIQHFVKSVAVEWAPLHIRVNCLAPGTIETEGLNNYPDTIISRMGKGNPMRAMGSTWDIAEGVSYLCSPAASFITGETLHIDGGMQVLGTNWPLGKPEWFEEM